MVSVVLCNRAVEHNVAMFTELALAVHGGESLVEASTVSNSANLDFNHSRDGGRKCCKMFTKLGLTMFVYN